jgi:uncharacterized membrane protein
MNAHAITTDAFIWTKTGGFQNLGKLKGRSASAFAIDDKGVVTGYAPTSNIQYPHAFLVESDTKR